MKRDYNKIINEEFDAMLEKIMDESPASHLLQIPGVYEAVSEHFNNEILDRCMDVIEEREGKIDIEVI